MDSRIEQLLEKYWNCETSLEEERQLKLFFSQQAVPEEWKETALLFQYFEAQKSQQLNERSFNKKVKSVTTSGKGVKMFFTPVKIAAGVIVLLAATFLVREEIRKSYPTEVVDTYSDPELAFKETKKALMMISKSFGKARQEAGKISVFNEAEQIIQNGASKEDDNEKEEVKNSI